MNLDESSKKIKASFIFEALGRPPEHLFEALKNLVEQIKTEEEVKVISEKVNQAVPLKDNSEFFTNFAEVEIETNDIRHVTILMFKYMPAHIEIISPENITLPNDGWNDILNELTRRLHGYDEVARIMQNEKAVLETKLRDILEKQNKSENKKTSNKKKVSKKSSTKKK